MSRKNGTSKVSVGEQMPLMDVGPENLKKIAPVAREYRSILKERLKLTVQEVKLKKKLHELIKESKLNQVDGKIKFACEGLDIEVEYRDEVIHIKEHKEPKKRGRKPKGMAESVADTEDED